MQFLIIMILYLFSPIFIASQEDYSLSPKELKDIKPFNDLSSKTPPLDNEKNKDNKNKQKEINEFITNDEELTEGPKFNLKLHLAPTYQFLYNLGNDTTSEKIQKNEITLPGARLGVSGSLGPQIDYIFITKLDNFKPDILLANFKLNFFNKRFFLKLGKYRPFLVREFTSRGDFLFTGPAAIYDSVLKNKNDFYPTVLGGQLGANFLDRKMNLYISFWMNNTNPLSEEFKKYSTAFRLQYDIHKPWKHGKEIFDKETPLNLTLGLSGAFIYQEYEGVNIDSMNLGSQGEDSLWMARHGLRILFDLKAKAHFFLFVAALSSNFYLMNYYVGVHFDFGFYTTKWLLIALRYSYRNDYLGLEEKTSKEKAVFINHSKKHVLGLVANFYPIKMDKTFSRNFKIQTAFEYFPKSLDFQIIQISIGAVLDF